MSLSTSTFPKHPANKLVNCPVEELPQGVDPTRKEVLTAPKKIKFNIFTTKRVNKPDLGVKSHMHDA